MRPVLLVHGGAGTIARGSMTPELEHAFLEALQVALRAGHTILARGGASLDAVEASVRVLEDDPLFNAGRGAAFTSDGRNELDAAIMDGRTRRAGAVACATTIKNPIRAARAVMERTPHVLLAGAGADAFAAAHGLDPVDPSYFWTERRWQALERERARHTGDRADAETRHGTVGAVALDAEGDLAAATSTGGTTNKLPGRVGDTPIIGAGTYADNASAAVSCTGDGEYFVRWTVARDLAALVMDAGLTVAQAGEEVIQRRLLAAGGEGGAIILDRHGRFALPFNCAGMYRGWIERDGVPHVAIYAD
jgi:isoaspartyl peptidase/L-asparaginase-like protein (Ntn-hydrolase superfamily)